MNARRFEARVGINCLRSLKPRFTMMNYRCLHRGINREGTCWQTDWRFPSNWREYDRIVRIFFWLWTKPNFVWFLIKKKTVSTIIFLSIWRNRNKFIIQFWSNLVWNTFIKHHHHSRISASSCTVLVLSELSTESEIFKFWWFHRKNPIVN